MKALGMTLLRRRSLLPQKTQQACWLGYGEEDDSTVLELVYEYNSEKIDRGDGYGQVRGCIQSYCSFVAGRSWRLICLNVRGFGADMYSSMGFRFVQNTAGPEATAAMYLLSCLIVWTFSSCVC